MKNPHVLPRIAIAALVACAMALAGCSQSGSSSSQSTAKKSATPAAPASASMAMSSAPAIGNKSIKLAYVEWSSCVAATNVVRAALEQKGYNVQTISVSAAAMYAAVADGDADATVCAWLPSTQANYYAKTKTKLNNLGPNLKGTKLGLVVPDYVTINSITQLAAHAKQFQNRIVGIDPGAGEMGLTQKVIKQYKLPLKLIDGSGATMTAALKSAIDNHQWIVVTGWTPHWMWARWKLKYLSDPKGIYGTSENIDTLSRKGLRKASPAAYVLLNGFRWTPKEMQQVMAQDRKQDSQPYDVAKKWVAAHGDTVAGWSTVKQAD